MADARTMKIGGRYNWRGQPERLVYLGRNWSGNGFWHQFERVGHPSVVWCEVLDSDLPMIEETPEPNASRRAELVRQAKAAIGVAASEKGLPNVSNKGAA